MSFIKNIDKSEVLTLKEQVSYQKGQVVSKTLAQNDALSVTLFAFDKDEEISTHESGGDAFVTCLDGVGRITIDGKAYEGRAYFGDLIMGACQAVGFEGMVIDGCTRNRDGNIELNFPVYSRGFMPRGPIKKDEGNINTPIQCGGVRVNPGDLVMGDSDGVCVIPVEYIETVLAEAEKKKAYEDKRTETIAAYRQAKKEGTPLPQLAPQWVLDMMK